MDILDIILNHINNYEFDEAISLWIQQTPDYIYKYIDLSNNSYNKNVINNLRNNELYFNNVANFDDKDEFVNMKYEIKNNNDINLVKQIQKMKFKNNLVTCFCEDLSRDEEMWKSYGGKGNGIRCKFKVKDKTAVLKVFYSNTKIFIPQLVDASNGESTEAKKNDMLYQLSFFIKKKEWKDQKEIRAIYDISNTPYAVRGNNPGYVSFKKILEIENIVIGNKLPNDLQKLIKQIKILSKND